MSFIDDIVSKGYGGYRGWDPVAAEEDYKKTGGQGKYDPGSSQQYAQQYGIQSQVPSYQAPNMQSFDQMVSQAQQMYQKAAEPAIQSLQATQPEIKSSIASKTQLLTDRYNNIISDIKGSQKTAEDRQKSVTAVELGKRGIDPTSGLYGQEVTSAINPITSEYTRLLNTAGSEQAQGIQGLADLETTQLRNIANAIAQIQSSSGTGGIDLAMRQWQTAQQAAENATTLAEQRRQTDIANALAEKIYQTITLPTSQANIANTQSLIKDRTSGGSGSSVQNTLQSLGIDFGLNLGTGNLGVGANSGGWQ